MIFRFEKSGKVSISVPDGSFQFTHPSDRFPILGNVLSDAADLLDKHSWDLLHLEGEESLALAHAGMPVADVVHNEDVAALFLAVSDVAGSVAPRILDKPAIESGQVAVQNSKAEKIDGDWILGWTVRDQTAQEIADDLAAWRETAVVTRGPFATAAMILGHLQPADAEAWGPGNALPPVVTNALAANITNPVQLSAARIQALSSNNVRRNNDLVEMLRAPTAFDLTAEEADEIFVLAKQIEDAS